jgi:hypothetical protein
MLMFWAKSLSVFGKSFWHVKSLQNGTLRSKCSLVHLFHITSQATEVRPFDCTLLRIQGALKPIPASSFFSSVRVLGLLLPVLSLWFGSG